MSARTGCVAIAVALIASFACGCRSYHIDANVENRTGAPVDLLEVDYPSASFGTGRLAADAVYHYRVLVRGQGPIKVQYNDSASHQLRQITGPELREGQEGRVDIVLLPGGKAEFHPALTPK